MRSSLFEFYKFENGGTERPQTFCYPKTNFLKPLQLQQIFLDLQPLGVAGQTAVCANDPVAGHHDAKWVAVAGAAYGAAGLGFAQRRRQLSVGAHLPVGNLAQLRPIPPAERACLLPPAAGRTPGVPRQNIRSAAPRPPVTGAFPPPCGGVVPTRAHRPGKNVPRTERRSPPLNRWHQGCC